MRVVVFHVVVTSDREGIAIVRKCMLCACGKRAPNRTHSSQTYCAAFEGRERRVVQCYAESSIMEFPLKPRLRFKGLMKTRTNLSDMYKI